MDVISLPPEGDVSSLPPEWGVSSLSSLPPDEGVSSPPPPPPNVSSLPPDEGVSSPPPPPPDVSSPPPPPEGVSSLPPWDGTTGTETTTNTQQGGISVGAVVGVVVGVVFLLMVVAVLVVFLVKRRRRLREEQRSLSPLADSQILFASKEVGHEEGRSIPNEGSRLSPLPSPPASLDFMHLPESQLHSKINSSVSMSSSVSVGESTQLSLASAGIRTFTYQELSEATNQFNQDKFLGRGGFGSVYQGVLGGEGGGVVAIKQLQTGSFQGEREFLTEINVISRIHHRNLVSLVGYCISGSERLLVYEYVENNNLGFHLQGTTTPVLDWPTRMSIASGAAKGFAYLHEECHPRIIHRDIKSTNILLDSNFRAKVADFGLAKLVPDDKIHVTTRIMGSFGYLAPEFGSSGRLTEKSDVFSFGVVLLELITGRQPINLVEWASQFLDQALDDGIFETDFIDPKLEGNYDYEEMNQMVTCAAISVHRFPDHRPKMSQVVQVLEGNISPEKLKAQIRKPALTPHRCT